MKLTKRNRDEWANDQAKKTLDVILRKLERTCGEDDSLRDSVAARIIIGLVHRQVLDTLSVRKDRIKTVESKVLLAQVADRFNHWVVSLESGIGQAFEHGVNQAANKSNFYICKISSIVGSSNNEKLPS